MKGNLVHREKKDFCYREEQCQLLPVMPALLLLSSPPSSWDHSMPPVCVAAYSEVSPCTLHHQTGTLSFMDFTELLLGFLLSSHAFRLFFCMGM